MTSSIIAELKNLIRRCSFLSLNKARSVYGVMIVLSVFLYYFWLAGTNGAPFVTRETADYYSKEHSDEIVPEVRAEHYGFYNLLADAFERGQLHLPVAPLPELLSLADPYNPQINAPYRLHDASLYKGKYYLYFGPVPVLTVFLPIRWITGIKVTEPFVAALFSFGAFFVSFLVVNKVILKLNIKVSGFIFLLCAMALGFGTSISYFLRRPTVYEVAISGGAFFTMLGAWLLLGCCKNKPNLLTTAAGSLCFGFALGCRPVYVVCGVLLFYLWVEYLVQQTSFNYKNAFVSAVAFGFPFTFVLLILGVYNFLRFHSWAEFGSSYQLASVILESGSLYRLDNMLPGTFLSLFSLPNLVSLFPFIQLQTFYPWRFPQDYYVLEPIGGVLITTAPLLFLGILCSNAVRRDVTSHLKPIIFLGFSIFAFEMFLFPSVTMRYQIDYVYLLLIPGLISWMYVLSRIKGFKFFIFKWVGVMMILTSICIHALLGFKGCQDLFRRSNPSKFFSTADLFSPISGMLIKSEKPAIIDLTNPAGGIRFEDGSEGYWIGTNGVHIRLYSPRRMSMVISFDLVTSVELSDGVKLTSCLPDGSTQILHRKRPGFHRLLFSLNPGLNRIAVFAVPEAVGVTPHVLSKVAVMKNLTISPVDGQ